MSPLENLTKRINIAPLNVQTYVAKFKSFKIVKIRSQPLEKIPKINKRTPMFIPESRVSNKMQTRFQGKLDGQIGALDDYKVIII